MTEVIGIQRWQKVRGVHPSSKTGLTRIQSKSIISETT